MAIEGGNVSSGMEPRAIQPHGEPRTKDGYPLWSDSPSVTAARTLILMEDMDEAGVSVDQWAAAIGRSPARVRRWLNERKASDYLTDDMVTATCELLHVGVEHLRNYYVAQPMVTGICEPTEAAPTKYAPEKLLEAYAMLDATEQEKVTTYIADLLSIHRLLRENDRISHDYEKRLDYISDTLTVPMTCADATADDFRMATIKALQPPYLSDQESMRLDRPTFNGSPILPPVDSEEFEKRYTRVHDGLLPNGRPRRDADQSGDAESDS